MATENYFPSPGPSKGKKGAGRFKWKAERSSSSHVTNNAALRLLRPTVDFASIALTFGLLALNWNILHKEKFIVPVLAMEFPFKFRFCCKRSRRCPLPTSESNALRRCYLRASLRNRVCGATCKLHVCIVEHIECRARECSLPECQPRGEVHPWYIKPLITL